MRKIAILPTLLTLGNAVSGFAAIAFVSRVDSASSAADIRLCFGVSGALIVLAMLFDALDGYVARLAKSASEFGAQLDSLCDAISFGVAPAFLLLRLGQVDWAESGLARYAIAIVAGLYMVCTILRLARFNLETTTDPASHKRFKGLPSPAAAGCLASLAILRSELASAWVGLDRVVVVESFVRVWAPIGTLLVALLMVSRLSYPHFTRQLLRGRRSFRFVVQAVLVVFLIALTRDLACFLLFWAYALNGPVRYLLVRGRRGQTVPVHSLE